MCGIIGYAGPRKTSNILLEGLRRLEYRGYDSAGIAVGGGGTAEGELRIIKEVGKISALKEIIKLVAAPAAKPTSAAAAPTRRSRMPAMNMAPKGATNK